MPTVNDVLPQYNKITEKTMKVYNRLYPEFTDEEILQEIKEFDDIFIFGKVLRADSSNYTKYLRGWMGRAYSIKYGAILKSYRSTSYG